MNNFGFPSAIRFTLLFAFWISIPQSAISTVWVEDRFEDFVDGEFLDAGSNLYVSAKGRLQMINRWDLNGDGYLDIVLPSGHGHTEKEDAFLYLNNGLGDIDGRSLVKIPTNGGVDGAIRDFNRDGMNDLAICNYDNGVTYQTDTYVYYGTAKGYDSDHRTILPTIKATQVEAGDFDGDGWDDLLVVCAWQENYLDNQGEPTSFVFWNSPDGFDPHRRTPLVFEGAEATSAAAADVDGDGAEEAFVSAAGKLYLLHLNKAAMMDPPGWEVIEAPAHSYRAMDAGDSNGDGRLDLALAAGDEILILRGDSDGGFSLPPLSVEASKAVDLVLEDLNGDGLDDIAVANSAGADRAPWVRSYVYFSSGDSYPTDSRMELPTMSAHGVSAGDLNGDSFPELVFSNRNITNQHRIPSIVFWNEGGSFRKGRHTLLDTQGAMSNAIGDANHDGLPDVVFFNLEGNFRDGASVTRIFWGGGDRNYSVDRSTEIFSHYINSVGHADLDDDGHVDLLLTQERFINAGDERIFNPLIIVWGSPEGFQRRTNLTVDSLGGGVRAVDLNSDGYLDLFVGGTSADPGQPNAKGPTLFWGGENGYSNSRRTIIDIGEGESYRAPLVSDLNKDGRPDLAFQRRKGYLLIFWGKEENLFSLEDSSEIQVGDEDFFGYLNVADLNGDGWLDLVLPVRARGRRTATPSYVYYGSKEGFSTDRRQVLEAFAVTDMSVADYDQDGFLDLFFHSYKDNFFRNTPMLLYWGSPGGFSEGNRKKLPGWGSAGVESADYDGDGWIDVMVSNHCRDGSTVVPGPQNHMTPSFLYWNSPDGFSENERTELPGIGPHAMNTRDIGNSYNRGLFEDYISSPFQIPDGEKPVRIGWEAETAHGTGVALQLRVASTQASLSNSEWFGPEKGESWFLEPGSVPSQSTGGWIQYRARLKTADGGNTPYLTQVALEFE